MITASRLGSAPITLDWSNLTRAHASPNEWIEDARAAWTALRERFSAGEVGFYDAPVRNELSQLNETLALAERISSQGVFTDALFLGIGGSALGPISLLSATPELQKRKLRCHFIENPDPLEWKQALAGLNPQSTLVVAVTKSGTTFETLSQLLLACEWLGKERWKTHLVAVTDPVKGDLRAFASAQGIPSLAIAPSIGGRFSIFSPVGLLPAALTGLDAQAFMTGARQIRDFVEKASLDQAAMEKNPLFILGTELIRQSQKRSIHVCMPYSTRLRLIGDWFVQLWGESLGKDGKGFTPIAAVGATDQHSILQLLRDGPDDKVTLFITLDQVGDEVKIPRLGGSGLPGSAGSGLAAFKLLEGHSLQELLTVEYRATSRVLTQRGRPNATWQLDRLDERALGALYYAFAILTSFTGARMGINPFDQPGVEEGKVYIRESLSQSESKTDSEDDDNSPVGRLRRGRE